MTLTLSDDADYLYVKLQLIDAGPPEVHRAMQWYCGPKRTSPARRSLIEFLGVLLASFKYTLEGLQQMYRKPDLPFSRLLAPGKDEFSELDIQPPLYARKAGFFYDLACLTYDSSSLTVSALRPTDPEVLVSCSTLDPTQSSALLNILKRELSLIQGPPGTGKSYTGEKLIKVLLANKTKSQIGPILCVCYTNHALDQLLEHLLDDGTENVICIGSRSKFERLAGLNLRIFAGKMDRTKSEKSVLCKMKRSIGDIALEINELLEQLSNSGSWRTIQTFLLNTYPGQHEELFGKVDDRWTLVNRQPENHRPMACWRFSYGQSSLGSWDSRECITQEFEQRGATGDLQPLAEGHQRSNRPADRERAPRIRRGHGEASSHPQRCRLALPQRSGRGRSDDDRPREEAESPPAASVQGDDLRGSWRGA